MKSPYRYTKLSEDEEAIDAEDQGGDGGGGGFSLGGNGDRDGRGGGRGRGGRRGGPVPPAPWPEHMESILQMARSDRGDLQVEAMGILANLTKQDMTHKGTTFAEFMQRHSLVEWLHQFLVPGLSEDDIVLQVIIFIGAMCVEREAAKMVADSQLLRLLEKTMQEKADDPDILLQTYYALWRILRFYDQVRVSYDL